MGVGLLFPFFQGVFERSPSLNSHLRVFSSKASLNILNPLTEGSMIRGIQVRFFV